MLAKLIAEDWAQLWPNVFAISFWTVIMFAWHHFALKKHITAEHEKSRTHLELHVNGQSGNESVFSGQEATLDQARSPGSGLHDLR